MNHQHIQVRHIHGTKSTGEELIVRMNCNKGNDNHRHHIVTLVIKTCVSEEIYFYKISLLKPIRMINESSSKTKEKIAIL